MEDSLLDVVLSLFSLKINDIKYINLYFNDRFGEERPVEVGLLPTLVSPSFSEGIDCLPVNQVEPEWKSPLAPGKREGNYHLMRAAYPY